MIEQSTIDLIVSFEGLSLTPYQDIAGVWTIGYGFTTYNGRPVTSQTPQITTAQAQAELAEQLQAYGNAVSSSTTATLNQNEFDACVSLAYNIGIGGFYSSSVLKCIHAGDMQNAANAFLMWDMAGGQVSQGLLARRQKERALFLTPL